MFMALMVEIKRAKCFLGVLCINLTCRGESRSQASVDAPELSGAFLLPNESSGFTGFTGSAYQPAFRLKCLIRQFLTHCLSRPLVHNCFLFPTLRTLTPHVLEKSHLSAVTSLWPPATLKISSGQGCCLAF